MKKPLIGLTPQYDYETQKLWMRPNYLEAVEAAGGLPLVLPLISDPADISELARSCNGILFTGGPDIHPALFGEETMQYSGAIDERRDTLEIALLKEADAQEKPVLGICRGIQLINVALGGTIYQDIPAQVRAEPICHSQEPPYDVPVHNVRIERDSPLSGFFGAERILVNSMHHQAVKDVAPALKCAARSADGLTEAVYRPDRAFFLGVQWHPEYLWKKHTAQLEIFRKFVESCKSAE